MKKLITICLIFTLVITLFSNETFATSGTDSFSKSIPKVDYSSDIEKVYEYDFPKEATQILKDAITFSGTGTLVKAKISIDDKNRKIKITIAGKKSEKKSEKVVGLRNDRKEWFPANPGNAMCRYSNGVDWQVATERTGDFAQLLDKYILTGQKAPTNPPYTIMKEIIASSSPKIPSGIYWFDGLPKDEQDKTVKSVESSIVDMTSIKIAKNAKSLIGTIVYPSNYNENNPTIGVRYKPTFMDVENPFFRDIGTNNPAFLTGEAVCKLYPASYEYYVTAFTKPSTGYSYEGTIAIPYIINSNAAIVGTLTPDPNSVKFEDKDIPVKLMLEANVFNLDDLGAIDYYQVYLHTDEGQDIVAGEKYPAGGKGTFKQSYNYTIPKAVMSGKNEFTQVFKARVRAYYKASSKYVGYLDTGLLSASTYVYKETTPPTPPPPNQAKPVAVINGMSEVKLGDDTVFDGFDSYDSDGYIESYRWVMPGAKEPDVVQDKYDPNYSSASAWYDKLGPQKVLMYVKDNDGLQDGTYHSFVVVEPSIEASINQTGTLKENRKVTFTEQSSSPSRYPVVAAKTTWKIESYMGDIPASAIKVDGSLKGQQSIDVLFKQPGEYRVTLSVENTAGYMDTVSRVYTIKPDEVPQVDFTFQQNVYRDPLDGNQATFQLTDHSYSTDGDTIVSRKWYVVYDANNDGNFGEAKVLFSSGNETYVEYKTTKVGKYAFYLEVQEEFGQPTITKFVTADDRKKANTWD